MADEAIAVGNKSAYLPDDLRAELAKEGFGITLLPDYVRISKDAQELVVFVAWSPRDFRLCRRLCEEASAPVFVLTAGGEKERVQAFRSGADDCMTMPVNKTEFIARVRALLRRPSPREEAGNGDSDEPFVLNDLFIDTEHHRVKLADSDLDLTLREFELLLFLAKNKGFVFGRKELLRQVWGSAAVKSARTVDTHICRLRKKLEVHSGWADRLVSVRGFGYKLRE
ncbi:MAG: response regulator transcription factor [Chloroflexi bacterium]|nr:response regulator transcription factor [Chloroflexota bacterium]